VAVVSEQSSENTDGHVGKNCCDSFRARGAPWAIRWIDAGAVRDSRRAAATWVSGVDHKAFIAKGTVKATIGSGQ